ncbi:alpha/beta fold hydrolase [Amycolatopsis suaedae]|uniref:alpha/beta fold hydrolase n=1 Tax=Amycolatopsis suaedae TaxID=2510978 RepID=UPI0013EF19C2|nr:alpha/beta fold hydrolase [Amycolatopsis suaedae]
MIHARWHGAWCWEDVATRLRQAGDDVLVPDRAGYDALRDLIAAQPEPVVLVGHSSSGMTISALAEELPRQVSLLVYVSAFLLPAGLAPPDVMRDDPDSILAEHIVVDPASATMTVSEPEKVLFGECEPERARWAAARLAPEPLTPPPVPAVRGDFGGVPRVYVECLRDRALGPATQRRMYTRLPCRHVYELPADHSPFLSTPDALTRHLRDAAARAS